LSIDNLDLGGKACSECCADSANVPLDSLAERAPRPRASSWLGRDTADFI
jgi:hypothetical protein